MNLFYSFEHNNIGDYMSIFLLCIEIFCARIIDVSLGTVRTFIVVKGKNFLGSLIGFVEVAVWFLVVEQALNTTSNNLFIVFSYALGFAVGTYLGGLLSSRFIHTKLEVQVITSKPIKELTSLIRDNGYALSFFKLENNGNFDKYMIFIDIDGKKLNKLKKIIKGYDADAFIVVNEATFVQNGYFGVTK